MRDDIVERKGGIRLPYYLAHQNIRDVCEEIFGGALAQMAFKYNKRYKYWYRVTKQGIIQFLGMGYFSGGTYEMSFVAQPLYVPLYVWGLEERRGVVPSFSAQNGDQILRCMVELGQFSARLVPRVAGSRLDLPENTRKHMKLAFEVVVEPVFKRAIDVRSCYLEERRLAGIRKDMVKNHNYEYWKTYSAYTSDFEIYCLLDMGEYECAEAVIEADTAVRKAPVYDVFLPYIKKRDDAAVRELIDAQTALNNDILQKCGFDLEH